MPELQVLQAVGRPRNVGVSPIKPIDVEQFRPVLDEALAAFRVDVAYAVEMSARAVIVRRKRETWAARTVLLSAQASAIAQCRTEPEFRCEVQDACGTGPECPFAPAELAGLRAPAGSGRLTRPQPRSGNRRFSVEAAVPLLVAQRRQATQATAGRSGP